MNFNQWYNKAKNKFSIEEYSAKAAWYNCQIEILKLLEQNKELESISHNGKKVYKIYGTVIEKIKNEI